MELGAQEIYCQGKEDDLTAFVEFFVGQKRDGWRAADLSRNQISTLADRGFASKLFKACGFEYRALDIFDGDDVILFDLNLHPVPQELAGRFDLVTNFGTTEHLINQYLAMKSIHELTKSGGCIYHHLPMGGYHSHGYFNYNPMFFEHLARANNYEVLLQRYSANPDSTPTPAIMKACGYPEGGWVDLGIEFLARKPGAAPFRMPLETSTSLDVNPAVWGDTVPYVRSRSAIIGQVAAVTGFNDENADLIAATRQTVIDETTGWVLQKELARRYVGRLKRWFGLA